MELDVEQPAGVLEARVRLRAHRAPKHFQPTFPTRRKNAHAREVHAEPVVLPVLLVAVVEHEVAHELERGEAAPRDAQPARGAQVAEARLQVALAERGRVCWARASAHGGEEGEAYARTATCRRQRGHMRTCVRASRAAASGSYGVLVRRVQRAWCSSDGV